MRLDSYSRLNLKFGTTPIYCGPAARCPTTSICPTGTKAARNSLDPQYAGREHFCCFELEARWVCKKKRRSVNSPAFSGPLSCKEYEKNLPRVSRRRLEVLVRIVTLRIIGGVRNGITNRHNQCRSRIISDRQLTGRS